MHPTQTLWQCPNCQNELNPSTSGLVCAKGHNFDRAKQGYINLLLANKKHSRDPGDDQSMIDARRAFLQAGHYGFLVENIASLIRDVLVTGDRQESANASTELGGSAMAMVDIGCGEGYYLGQLQKILSCPLQILGMDISKFAVKRAAPYLKQAQFAVASSFDIPILANSVRCALSVFAPFDSKEVARILDKTQGCFIRVTPGPRHLYQIKQALYEQANLHEPACRPDGFDLLTEKRLHKTLSLSGAGDLANLLAMTPLNWHGRAESKTELLAKTQVNLEVDFCVQVFTVAKTVVESVAETLEEILDQSADGSSNEIADEI